MSASTSRNAYTALTPEYADFAIPHTAIGAQHQQISTLHSATLESPVADSDFGGEEYEGIPGFARIRTLQVRVREVLGSNTGLLLVAASQAFLSLVNVAVKKLNGIDPPVPTLEVCVSLFLASGSRAFDVDVSDFIVVVQQLVAVRMVRVHSTNDQQPESNRFSFDRL
jgi:hypothetical protein